MDPRDPDRRDTVVRQSGVELLRIIAMVLIVISHCKPSTGIDYGISSHSFSVFVLNIFHYFGQIGNAIFIVCSSWFLADSKKAKPVKIMGIAVDVWFFSWLFLTIFMIRGENLTANEMRMSNSPVLTASNWFVTCYILFYMIHPLINRALDSLTQKQFFITSALALIYAALTTLRYNSLYSELLGFAAVYIVTAYVKRYMKVICDNVKLNRVLFIISAVLLTACIAAVNVLGFKIDFFSDRLLEGSKFRNPVIIIMAISLLNIFRNLSFQSKAVNTVASTSLLVYVIHENVLVRTYFRPAVWEYIYNTFSPDYVVLQCLAFSAVLFTASLLIALLYKFTLKKPIGKFCAWFCERAGKICNKMIDLCIDKTSR